MKLEEAERRPCRCCRCRSSPSTSGRTCAEDEVKTYSNEPESEDAARRRLGPVQARRGQGRRFDRTASSATTTTGTASRRSARSTCRIYQVRGHSRPVAQGRRDRLRRGRQPAADQGPRGAARHHRAAGRLAWLRRVRLQHRVGRRRHRQAAGRPQPGSARPEVPLRAELRHRSAGAGRQGLPGRRHYRHGTSSRRPTRPIVGSRRATTPSPTTPTRPSSCSTKPATRSAPTDCRTMPDGDADRQAAALRAVRLRDFGLASDDFFQEWLSRRRHRLRRSRRSRAPS